LPGEVGLGEQREAQRCRDEAGPEAGTGDVDDSGVGHGIDRVVEPSRHVLAPQHLDQPLRRAVSLGGHHDAPTIVEPGPHVVERALGVTAVAIDGLCGGRDR
jgi:hypothetical protein